jgi:hypothetical protein
MAISLAPGLSGLGSTLKVTLASSLIWINKNDARVTFA